MPLANNNSDMAPVPQGNAAAYIIIRLFRHRPRDPAALLWPILVMLDKVAWRLHRAIEGLSLRLLAVGKGLDIGKVYRY